mmetsp:Transcript_108339/g.349710  ORF Transcript_108339/g.349710 Transcript_108339/m.349710 type:complete len:220 (-) Transcript_108339:39-698(-)
MPRFRNAEDRRNFRIVWRPAAARPLHRRRGGRCPTEGTPPRPPARATRRAAAAVPRRALADLLGRPALRPATATPAVVAAAEAARPWAAARYGARSPFLFLRRRVATRTRRWRRHRVCEKVGKTTAVRPCRKPRRPRPQAPARSRRRSGRRARCLGRWSCRSPMGSTTHGTTMWRAQRARSARSSCHRDELVLAIHLRFDMLHRHSCKTERTVFNPMFV